jgi:hypothetical protein
VGSTPDFYSAVRRINGLSWLLDEELGRVEPDELFYDQENSAKLLRRRILAVSMNRTALGDLIKLFRMYSRGETLPHNFGAFSELFAHVKDVRPWEFHDRVADTGLEEYLLDQISIGGQSLVCSVELFSVGDSNRDAESVARVQAAIRYAGGEVLSSVVIADIRHAEIRTRIPIVGIHTVLDLESISVFRLDEVMFVRPRSQALVEYDESGDGKEEPEQNNVVPARTEPRLALLDGVPVQNHPLLTGRILFDDPDNLEASAPVQQRIHGTAMLSLVLHGDLATNQLPLDERVYTRPILLPRPTLHSTIEEIPEQFLPIDVVHRSIVRIASEAFTAAIRVVCLCVADVQRPLDTYVSPWAKLLDYLSWKYSLLFVVSAGNYSADVELNFPSSTFPSTSEQVIDEEFLSKSILSANSRPLLSPSEAINVLTVGATSSDGSGTPNATVAVPLSQDGHERPAPYSATGGGIRRMVKPEIFLPGGRQPFRLDALSPQNVSRLKPVMSRLSPGQEVASPPRSRSYLRGTSNAAALALRSCAEIMTALEPVLSGSPMERAEEVALLKAMLVHSASWGGAREIVARFLPADVPATQRRTEVARILGYGFAAPPRVTECTTSRVTVIATGKVKEESSIIFRFPMPPSLASKVASRTIITTLGYLCPIAITSRVYRSHNVWLSHSFRGQDLEASLGMRTLEAHEPLVSRGTVQHLLFRGDSAVPFIDGDYLELRVNCKRDSGERVPGGIPFGLVATLEVHTNLGIDLYDEVRARVRVSPDVQIRTSS